METEVEGVIMPFWKYERADVRDDVKTSLPNHYSLDIYKIRSGDSGKTYYTQILRQNDRGFSQMKPVYLCDCPEGIFKAPLSVLGLGPQCKHAVNLVQFLKERKT